MEILDSWLVVFWHEQEKIWLWERNWSLTEWMSLSLSWAKIRQLWAAWGFFHSLPTWSFFQSRLVTFLSACWRFWVPLLWAYLLCNLGPISPFAYWTPLSPLSSTALESSCPRILEKFQFQNFFKSGWPWLKYFIIYFFFLRKHLFIPFLYCITGRVSGCIMKRLGWAACILLQTCLSVEGECPKSWDQKSAGLVLTSQLNSLQGFCWVCKQQQRRKTSVLKWCNCSWLFPGGSCLTGQDDLTC